jgi:hypothetical protein
VKPASPEEGPVTPKYRATTENIALLTQPGIQTKSINYPFNPIHVSDSIYTRKPKKVGCMNWFCIREGKLWRKMTVWFLIFKTFTSYCT